MTGIRTWLEGLGLDRHIDAFVENAIDVDILTTLTAEDLSEIGIPLGDRKRLLAAIAVGEAGERTAEEAHGAAAVERRQVSVLFCDLVGSTALSERLDPEDLRDVMRAYQDAVSAAVGPLGGYVANYLGDGIVAYFGWPRASEDQAARAVKAGLSAITKVSLLRTPDGINLAARAGVASGRVVVGDLVGDDSFQSDAISGETPNRAARLQDGARPGEQLIDGTTRALLAGAFELSELGERSLKGLSGPVRLWQVLGEANAASRFEAAHAGHLTPLVGREPEVDLLRSRWHQAAGGDGQVVLLSGEPGIGKSRLVHALQDRLGDGPHERFDLQCSPQGVDSPLHPAIGLLERLAQFVRSDDARRKIAKLETVLLPGSRSVGQSAILLGPLLSLPVDAQNPPSEVGPERQMEVVLEVLVEQLLGPSEPPRLIVFEDLHWADPTTLLLLNRLIERCKHCRALLLMTTRPGSTLPTGQHPHLTELTLNRFGQAQGAELIARLTRDTPLPAPTLAAILEKADGVPLFVEELTRSVLESQAGIADGATSDVVDIPSSLEASLLARLDRQGRAKTLAQIGSVLGRTFEHALLARLIVGEDAILQSDLEQLVRVELLTREGTAQDLRYSFRHALVRDAVYNSLLKRRRRELHSAVAALLRDQDAEGIPIPPELIAHHLSEAGEMREAIDWWQRGAEAALKRSAYAEADSQLRRGLECLDTLPASPERLELELKLQTTLGPVLMVTKGQTATEVMHTYARSRVICSELGDERQLGPVLIGLWRCQQGRGEAHKALTVAEEALRLASRTGDEELTVDGLMAVGTAHYFLGEMIAAHEELERGIAAYQALDHVPMPGLFIRDPGVVCLTYLGNVLWPLGYPDQARSRAKEAIDLAREINHPLSLCHALWQATFMYANRGDWQVSSDHAATFLHLTRKRGLGPWNIANATMSRSRAQARLGQMDEALTGLSEALEIFARLGPLTRTNRSMAAEIQLLAGETEQGLAMIDGQPSLDWLRGELLLSHAAPDAEGAESAFRAALDQARKRSTRSLELRATLSLARLWRDQGCEQDSCELLTPIVDWFTEGFETKDLVDAKALLSDLARAGRQRGG